MAAKPVTPPAPLPKAAPRATTADKAPGQAAATPAPDKAKSQKAEAAKAQAAKVAAVKPESDTPASTAVANISAADLMKIEQELYWSGDYSAAVNGEDRMQAAIKSFQKRNKAKITGELTAEQSSRCVSPPTAISRNSAGAWWSIRRPASASACRASWYRTRMTPRTARAGRRRMARSRSRPSASRTPRLPRCSSEKKKTPRRIEHSALTMTALSSAACRG